MTTQRALRRSVLAAFFVILPMVAWGQTTAIHAGRLIDPETGTEQQDQIILVEEGSIVAVGPNVPVPNGAEEIDLSHLSVLPGAETTIRRCRTARAAST